MYQWIRTYGYIRAKKNRFTTTNQKLTQKARNTKETEKKALNRYNV